VPGGLVAHTLTCRVRGLALVNTDTGDRQLRCIFSNSSMDGCDRPALNHSEVQLHIPMTSKAWVIA